MTTTAQQLIANAKARIREVTSTDVRERMARGEKIVLIDVREQNEWNLGHIPDAMHIGRGVLETNVEGRVPRDATIVLYCASGNRSALAACSLQEMGYANVTSMAGGIKDWVATGGEIAD
jgi:rhodanese-related sulfurtransferase